MDCIYKALVNLQHHFDDTNIITVKFRILYSALCILHLKRRLSPSFLFNVVWNIQLFVCGRLFMYYFFILPFLLFYTFFLRTKKCVARSHAWKIHGFLNLHNNQFRQCVTIRNKPVFLPEIGYKNTHCDTIDYYAFK